MTPADHWLHFALSFLATIPALLAGIAALIQSMRNGGKAQSNRNAIEDARNALERVQSRVDQIHAEHLNQSAVRAGEEMVRDDRLRREAGSDR